MPHCSAGARRSPLVCKRSAGPSIFATAALSFWFRPSAERSAVNVRLAAGSVELNGRKGRIAGQSVYVAEFALDSLIRVV